MAPMDELFRPRPGSSPESPEPTEHLDPLLDRRLDRHPWEVRSAQWRAWALAEEAFGNRVQVRLTGRAGAMGFRGLLTLSVPFTGLGDHHRREALFLAWVGRDPVLTRIPLIFVFEPAEALRP